jgi:hypothetical protein
MELNGSRLIESGCRHNENLARVYALSNIKRDGGRHMSMQSSDSGSYQTDSVVRFAPRAVLPPSDDADQLDKAGQTILALLHKAAGVAEENSRHALDMAQKLSHQLRAAEARIAELESEVELYRDKADRAEEWLHKVYTEIEERFLKRPQEKSRVAFTSPGRRV